MNIFGWIFICVTQPLWVSDASKPGLPPQNRQMGCLPHTFSLFGSGQEWGKVEK